MKSKTYDVIIIGAGASGLMCATHLRKNKKILIIDANDKIARKIKISGGGKCNITNKYVSVENYVGKKDFVAKTLAYFDNEALLSFLKKNGLKPVLKKGRFYFCQNSSDEIIDMFKRLTKHCDFSLATRVEEVTKEEELFRIRTAKGVFLSKNLIVASGGASFPSIGASDIALKIAEGFGIAYTPFRPALVGLTLQKEQFWMKGLSGISVDVAITIEQKRIEGSLLFAHRGISGPAVLDASLYWKKGEIEVDFLPRDNLKKLLHSGRKKQITSVLPIPKRFTKAFLDHVGLTDKACDTLTDEDLLELGKLKKYRFAPAGNFGFSKAEVSLGGVKSEELCDNFETKKVKSLYFIGECVDITGELGGYNFQWAFGNGYICALSTR